jgi:hypothetical protein
MIRRNADRGAGVALHPRHPRKFRRALKGVDYAHGCRKPEPAHIFLLVLDSNWTKESSSIHVCAQLEAESAREVTKKLLATFLLARNTIVLFESVPRVRDIVAAQCQGTR